MDKNTPKIIVISGCDRTGKATQTEILTRLLNLGGIPAIRLETPTYDTPISKLMGAMLDGAAFEMKGAYPLDRLNTQKYKNDLRFKMNKSDGLGVLRGGDFYGAIRKGGPSMIYQLLAIAHYFEVQPSIAEALSEGKMVICDRYCIDSYIYGRVDCGDIDWIIDAQRSLIQPDIEIILDSSGYERAGEMPDDNEKRADFQKACRGSALHLADKYGWNVVYCDRKYNFPDDDSIDVKTTTVKYIQDEIHNILFAHGIQMTVDQNLIWKVVGEVLGS